MRRTDAEPQEWRNSCPQLQPRSVLGSFGVVLMPCKVNFHLVRSTLQNSMCLLFADQFFYRSYLLRHIRLRSFAVFKNVKLNSLRGAGAKRGVGRGRKAQKGCQSQIPSPFSLLSPPLLTHEVRNMTIATVVQRLKHKYLYGGKTIVTVAYKCVSLGLIFL